MTKPIIRVAAVAVASVGLTVATLAPASGAVKKVRDPDGSGPLNIKSAKIVHAKKRVAMSTKVANLKRKKDQGVIFRISGKPKGQYAVVVSLKKKPRTALVRYGKSGAKPVKCKKMKTNVSIKRDRAKVVVPRKCLSKPKRIKVNVKTGKISSNRLKDSTGWIGWVKRG